MKMKNELRYVPISDFDIMLHYKMRTRSMVMKAKKDLVRETCILCKDKKCIVDHSENKVYSGRITRSITKWLKCVNNFVVIEVYRSMPLLGDEGDIPNWDVHLVHYSIVFSDNP